MFDAEISHLELMYMSDPKALVGQQLFYEILLEGNINHACFKGLKIQVLRKWLLHRSMTRLQEVNHYANSEERVPPSFVRTIIHVPLTLTCKIILRVTSHCSNSSPVSVSKRMSFSVLIFFFSLRNLEQITFEISRIRHKNNTKLSSSLFFSPIVMMQC